MKFVINTVLIVALGMLTYGYYVKQSGDVNGEIIIGISVLIVAFVLMPLFIYHRYKNKNIKDFTFNSYRKDLEKHIKENK
tara:strand:+ start:1106 stop:1345 length:240 start_codon:yes stop_codon:yes gene_type:complete